MFHERGSSNVTIYNFGIDSAVVADELTLLKRFGKAYGIDQVVFLTGANDVTSSYMNVASPPDGFAGLIVGINAFELSKFIGRLTASHSVIGSTPKAGQRPVAQCRQSQFPSGRLDRGR